MFKTILKIAVLSATAMTLLSACGAAKKALSSAADDALNAALAKAEKRYEKRYTEAISNLIDDKGDPLKVYIDENGTPFHVTIDENGNPIKVTIDDKINSIKAKTDDKGNPIQVTIDDKGNPIPVSIDDKSDPILAVPTTAEICSGKELWHLWGSPCDKDEASIQRLHEDCLSSPFRLWPVGGCAEDNRYHDARIEKCAVDFSWECEDADGVEFYLVRIKFCNKPANAGHDACVTPLEPQVYSEGSYYNQFLQGTEDGLNTGSLHASAYDATAPVVHILKLSDSDDGVAFFAGIRPDVVVNGYAGLYGYHAGILPDPNLGAPITQTRGTATWQGTFSVIDSYIYNSDIFRADKDFDLEIDFATKQLSASINGVENNGVENKDTNNQLNPWTHIDYSLSGAFADGKIEGKLHATFLFSDPKYNNVQSARVQGLIGQDGAVAAFIGNRDSIYDGTFSGGFVARPPSE